MAKRGINKVMIMGNVGQEPKIQYLPNNTCVANFSIATSETWLNSKSGQQQERTEWHRVAVYGKLAEIIAKYVISGTKIYVEGELRTRKWQNQQGQDQYTTEVVLQGYGCNMQLLGGTRQSDDNAGGQHQAQQSAPLRSQQQSSEPQYDEPPMSYDDDIPFMEPIKEHRMLMHCC
ncbi:single-stranded DNA-binding protein (plasmid) [Photobacterium leiognathi subsp. mandapamensis]|uniref:single-stranded DNA-binding protein n=1 Tax=Photobacterium leiognathi TaxID=553611 RepID=UPI003AF409CF